MNSDNQAAPPRGAEPPLSPAAGESPDSAAGQSVELNPVESGAPASVITGAHGSAALRVGDLPPAKNKPAFVNVFLPNRTINPLSLWVVAAVEAAIFLTLWVLTPYKVLPTPVEVLTALQTLWMEQGLGQQLAVSFGLNLQALLISTVISLGLAYATVIPAFRPLVAAVSKGRFLSLLGFSFIFTIVLGGGRQLEVALLVFAVTVFYVTSMAAVIAAIPRGDFEHARTLRMSEWRVVWEVVILGTVDKAFEVLRQNAAMGWMMLTMVEPYARSQGGVGVFLQDESKHLLLGGLFAIQLLIMIVGMLQDYGINFLRRMACPYADMTLERK